MYVHKIINFYYCEFEPIKSMQSRVIMAFEKDSSSDVWWRRFNSISHFTEAPRYLVIIPRNSLHTSGVISFAKALARQMATG